MSSLVATLDPADKVLISGLAFIAFGGVAILVSPVALTAGTMAASFMSVGAILGQVSIVLTGTTLVTMGAIGKTQSYQKKGDIQKGAQLVRKYIPFGLTPHTEILERGLDAAMHAFEIPEELRPDQATRGLLGGVISEGRSKQPDFTAPPIEYGLAVIEAKIDELLDSQGASDRSAQKPMVQDGSVPQSVLKWKDVLPPDLKPDSGGKVRPD
jgi:hypothetical protein